MNFRSFSALASLVTLGSLFIAAGCSDDADTAGNGTSSSSSGGTTSSSGGSSGTSGTSSSSGGDGGGTGGTFWFLSNELPKVGSSDLSGAEKFSDDVEGKPVDIAVGGGSAWVITDGGKLLRYDLKAPVHATPVDIAKHPSHIVFAAGAVWVTEDNDGSACDEVNGWAKLLRIDPATSAVTKKIPVSGTTSNPCNPFDGLVTDGKAVFPLVNNSFGIARVDATTNEITKRAALGEGAGYGIGKETINDGAVWVLNRNGHFIIALDLTTLEVKSKTAVPAEYGGEFIGATKESVFINGSDKKALRVEVANPSNQEAKTLSEGANWFTAHDGALYMTALPEVISPVMLKLDPVTGAEQSRVAIPYLFSVGRFVFVE